MILNTEKNETNLWIQITNYATRKTIFTEKKNEKSICHFTCLPDVRIQRLRKKQPSSDWDYSTTGIDTVSGGEFHDEF